MLGLAHDLGANGIAVSIDHELRPGSDLTRYMERSIRESDFVVIVCTPTYAKRADERLQGVGYETAIITGEIFNTAPEHKFIPVLRKGDFGRSLPTYLGSRLALDFRTDGAYEDSLTRLVRHLWHQPMAAPLVVGDRPRFGNKFRARRSSKKRSDHLGETKKPPVPPGPKSVGARQTMRGRSRPESQRSAAPARLRWARENYRSRLMSNEQIFGPDHRVTLADRYDWSKRIGRAGDPTEAAKLYKTLAADFERIHGPRHKGHLAARRQQAYWSNEAGDEATATHLYIDLLRYYTNLLGSSHRYSRLCQNALNRLSAPTSRFPQATAA